MVRVVDPQQTHIWYETCSSCNGSYLDAGELKDLRQHDNLGLLQGPDRAGAQMTAMGIRVMTRCLD